MPRLAGMKLAFAALVVLACARSPQAPTGAAAGAPDASATADASTPEPTRRGPWVRDATVPARNGPAANFHSPTPGDLWLEITDESLPGHLALYHRIEGGWVPAYDLQLRSSASVWIRSPDEAWVLESSGMLHVVTPSGETIRDLSRPGRFYSALGDGWIAYGDPVTSGPCAQGGVAAGFLKITTAGFDQVDAPSVCWWATSIDQGAAVSRLGDLLFWNGTSWDVDRRLESPSCPPTTRCLTWGPLSGSGRDRRFLVRNDPPVAGSTWLVELFGMDWNTVQLEPQARVTRIWSRPWGPTWALTGDHAFERDETGWHDRAETPTGLAYDSPGPSGIGSDGTNVFATGEWASSGGAIWIYRYDPGE